MGVPPIDEPPKQPGFWFMEYATFILLALSLAWQLFADPIVGLASNGDYWRITEPVGLYYADPPEDENAYLVRTYVSGEADDWAGYRSSELLLVRVALALDRTFSNNDLFDIRVVGAVHSALYLLGAGIVLAGVRRFSLAPRIAVNGLLLLFFTDVAYVSYFNSFYSEPASLIFLMLMAGFGLLLISREQDDPWRDSVLVMFFLAALLLIIAKPQNGPLAIPLGLIGFRLYGLPLRPRREQITSYLLPGGLAVGLIIVGLVNPFIAHPDGFREANLFNVVFAEILGNSDDPEADLRAMGLDEDLVEYAGTHAYQPGSPVTEDSFHPRFFDHIGYREIGVFYLRHPTRFLDLMSRGAEHSATMRPDYLGNFEEATGKPPRAQSQTFAIWSNWKPRLYSNSLIFLTGFFAVSLAASLVIHRHFRAHRSLQLSSEFHIALLAMAGMQFVIPLIGEGEFEIVKHLFIFHALSDMALVVFSLVTVWAINLYWKHRDKTSVG
jgi:hypothetical protein